MTLKINISHLKSITKGAYEKAKKLSNEGKVHEAWRALADGGDNYARNAAEITNESKKYLSQELVKQTWLHTVGQEAYDQSFDPVAIVHLKGYISEIDHDNGYILPSTKQIEVSYKNALESQGLPTNVAIDAIINTMTKDTVLPGWDRMDRFV